jgi:hypothetical protein
MMPDSLRNSSLMSLDDLLDGLVLLDLRANLVEQVVAVERGDKGVLRRHIEVFQDVLLHFWSSRGRQGHDRHLAGDGVEHNADAAIFRAEIVAPFGDTVGFVDSHKRDVGVLEKLDVLFLGERFRRDEQQFGPAVGDVLLHLFHLCLGERGVEEVRYFVFVGVAADAVYLVFHQRDERTDDDGGAGQHQRGELVAEAFTAPGRHDDKSIFSI